MEKNYCQDFTFMYGSVGGGRGAVRLSMTDGRFFLFYLSNLLALIALQCIIVIIPWIQKRELGRPRDMEGRERVYCVTACRVLTAQPWLHNKRTQKSLLFSFCFFASATRTSLEDQAVVIFAGWIYLKLASRIGPARKLSNFLITHQIPEDVIISKLSKQHDFLLRQRGM